jgi:gas vesicle protein
MTMRPDPPSTPGTLLMLLLGGAVLGGLAMALTTPKTGREVRATLRRSLRRLGRAAADLDSLDEDPLIAMFI